jgi:uncharacterized protein YgiM (DUF1202 family)
MWKEKLRYLRDILVRHGKVVFPIILIIAAAFTVFVALSAKKDSELPMESSVVVESSEISIENEQLDLVKEIPEDPLMLNTDPALVNLVTEFFAAKAEGNLDVIHQLRNYTDETEEIQITEFAKYIESYPLIEIYTKPGYQDLSYITYVFYEALFVGHPEQMPGIEALYVCTNDQGELYINNDLDSLGQEEQEYMQTIHGQADVEELYNKVNYDYYELLVNHPDLEEYMDELTQEVKKAVGETLAAQIASEQPSETPQSESPSDVQPDNVGMEGGGEELNEEPAATGPLYATANTTVNVRASDSEQADKIGKVTGGTKVQVTEQKANGWSHVVFDEGEGYIKSEFLSPEALGEIAEAIGTVTAISNVNIRESASESAEKIGVVAGGDQVNLISRENGWCKITYGNLTGYVKEDYVE